MNLKFFLPIILLVGVAVLRQGYDGTVANGLGVEDHDANKLTIANLLNSDRGIVDLSPQRKVVVEDPESLRLPDDFGWKSYKPGMAGEGDTILVMDDVIAGHPGRQRKPQRPADYRMQRYVTGCLPRPPQEGERIVNASIGHTLNPSDLHAYSEVEMAEDTQDWLAAHFKRPRTVSEKTIVRDHDVPVADIAITDTSAPIYLILQHRSGRVLWNIHTAPGVTIGHIVTVGADTVALNPPPGDYDVEFLRAGTDCIPAVAREPQLWWRIFKKLDQEREDAYRDEEKAEIERRREALFTAHEAYDTWFREAFGRPSEQGVVGFDLTDYLLAGPPPASPEARVTYRPVHGATVLVSEQDYIFAAPEIERVAFMMQLQRDFIATAAGGTIDALYPEPMQRATQ